MRRRFFSAFGLCAAISVALCVITGALWVRSYSWEDYWRLHREPEIGLGSSLGEIWLFREARWRAFMPRDQRWLGAISVRDNDSIPHELASYHIPHRDRPLYDVRLGGEKVGVSFWLLMLVFLVCPAVWVVRRFRGRPPAEGLCPACGYNLRASKERCPECGRAIPETSHE